MSNKSQHSDIGQKVSLYEMLTDKNDVVECINIPKIQRDYAQGREGKEKLRERFLNSIFDIITVQDSDDLVLDFVFGQKESDYKSPFFPVDGQQRLTTLYLLSLYLGKRCGDYAATELETFRNRFKYQTRDSSEQFCTRHLFDIPSGNWSNIIEYIEDQWWYTDLWKSDPTITSMINMLADIHHKCSDFNDDKLRLMWNNLKTKVKFWRLYLKDLKIGSTEELYIKMNSRGKPLTDFEHFKAQIEEYVADDNEYQVGEFSKNIDTTWTRLFWGYRNKNADFVYEVPENNRRAPLYTDNGLEDKMLQFFRNYLAIYSVKNDIFPFSLKKDDKEQDLLSVAAAVLPGHSNIFNDIETILNYLFNQAVDGRLEAFFSRFLTTESEEERFALGKSTDYRVNINVTDGAGSKVDIFEQMCGNSFTIRQALIMEAFFKYILLCHNGDDAPTESDFLDRLRILRNLMANTHIQDNDEGSHKLELTNYMRTVDNLIESGLDVESNDKFTSEQKQKEQEKLALINTGVIDSLTLKQLENHRLLRGNLSQLEPLSDAKLNRFREIFTQNCNLDEVECMLLTHGDYSRISGVIRSFGGTRDSRYWISYIFQNANKDTAIVMDQMLSDNRDANVCTSEFLDECEKAARFTLPYYMVKYRELRQAPRGQYRMDENCRYKIEMCNASGGGYGGEQSWNPYNNIISCEFPPEKVKRDNYGGPLHLLEHGYLFNVGETSVEFNNDTTTWEISIPQIGGVDAIDRTILGKEILSALLQALYEKQPIESLPYTLTSRAIEKTPVQLSFDD